MAGTRSDRSIPSPVPESLRRSGRPYVVRTQTQARDLFDLKLLIDAGGAALPTLEEIRSRIPRAIENAMSISYDDFAGQVLAYLEPSYQQQYRARSVWNAMQEQVVTALEGLAS